MYNAYQPYQMQQPQQPQMQNGGFVLIPNENVAYNYPVALGNCVTFKVENKPIVIEKSMGFSQFESPRIDVYDLVKREMKSENNADQVDDIGGLKDEIRSLWDEINALKVARKQNAPKRKEVTANDAD